MADRKIITLSLNPAIDVTLELGALRPGEENPVLREVYQAAGKGANVARALAALGLPARAVVVLGRENSGRFLTPLEGDGVACSEVFVEGSIRENLTVLLPGQPPTRMMRQGAAVGEEALAAGAERLRELLCPGDILVVGGKLPPGVSPQRFVRFCREAVVQEGSQLEQGCNQACLVGNQFHPAGGRVKLVLDTSSLSAREVAAIAPAILKPNLEELQAMVERPLTTLEDTLDAAQALSRAGVGQVLVSLGADGLLYVGEGRQYRVTVPQVPIRSAVGAGDNLLAQFLYRRELLGSSLPESLRWAAAAGTASCLLEGTAPPRAQDTARLFDETTVCEL